MMIITRANFLKRAVQLILALVLGTVTLVLSRRTVAGSDCSSCPGKGICNGESDCSKFLTEKP